MLDGRMINEMKIDESIERRLDIMPDYVYGWHLTLKASKKTAATRRTFVNNVYHMLEFINPVVKEVKPEDITERVVTRFFLSIQTTVKNGKQVYTSDSYQGNIWSTLHNFFNYMVHHDLLKRNYMDLIERPANKDLDRINESRILLTLDDFRKILSVAENNARDKAILALFMNTGMRKTALLTIMLEDIDFEKNTLVIIDKGNKRQTYQLNDDMCSILKDWLKERGDLQDHHLFVDKNGDELSERSIRTIVEKYSKKALGRPVSPHKLRSGYCSILYNQSGDIEFVRRAVGHSQVSTTQRYVVTKGTEREKAAEMMKNIFC